MRFQRYDHVSVLLLDRFGRFTGGTMEAVVDSVTEDGVYAMVWVGGAFGLVAVGTWRLEYANGLETQPSQGDNRTVAGVSI
ncbi:hypothetical protein IU469_22405 [Nocardia puris]|uniref:hypothetical protein n=1 Tax=Nocardia puris TaxID=208602 RepID=UPI00189325F3|nr:hypothetical protein [Nocardia puris]MBF6368453.1 hypothetical protein [Nocardia puris]